MDYINKPPKIADYYADLGVCHTASKQQIRKAYRNLVIITHPDRKSDKSTDAADFRKVRREERRAAEEQAESERRAAEAEQIRKREEQRQADEERARLEKLREQKVRQAEERSRDAARRAWEERQYAARKRMFQEKVAEAERRSEEAAARRRAEQEKEASERLKMAQVEEKLNTARRRWKDMREACESSSHKARPRRPSSTPSTICAHPPFRWPKKRGPASCTFCGVSRKKGALCCPECGVCACPVCMKEFCRSRSGYDVSKQSNGS